MSHFLLFFLFAASHFHCVSFSLCHFFPVSLFRCISFSLHLFFTGFPHTATVTPRMASPSTRHTLQATLVSLQSLNSARARVFVHVCVCVCVCVCFCVFLAFDLSRLLYRSCVLLLSL